MSELLETFTGCGGQLRYICPDSDCTYDSYSELKVLKHWKANHTETDSISPGPTLFDADDQPIEKEIDVPESIQYLSARFVRRPDTTKEF